ncbi:AAA family ATPase [Vibrio cholerae]|uniref:AAA family ATPase n=1 Tax=Vibrio cholerae TaxID=666 RepID=UPI0039672137
MLSDINVVGGWFIDEPESGWYFEEVKFDDQDKQDFRGLPLDIEVFDYSARINISKNNNHCYIPSHYFLYAIKLQPLVTLLTQYMNVFEQVKNSVSSAVDFYNLVRDSSISNPILDKLDPFSRDNFISIFRSKENRLGGKDIINDDKKNGKKYRSTDDFMTSILLKALPVPDASSGALGDLLYAFSRSPVAYQSLTNNYSQKIPYLFKCSSGDEMIFRILSILGWKGKLDPLVEVADFSVGHIDWGNISGAFKLSGTKIPGNIHYFDEPIHYSPSSGKYVHIRKGLLSDSAGVLQVNKALRDLWPELTIFEENSEFLLKSSIIQQHSAPRKTGGCNRIIYGAPGTGKSHSIEQSSDVKFLVRTVFHPETQYSDFVGCLKPVMEGDRVAYRFKPGAFTDSLVKAIKDPNNNYSLVIEEINRAPAAAVFGELFQLLDREPDGSSRYQIDISDPDLLTYLNTQTGGYFTSGKLSIPSNLSLLATMNSSDQAVMPLDTAFKRRWSFEYVQLSFDKAPSQVLVLQTSEGLFEISWSDFADKVLNNMLKEFRVPEDRMIGPFFLNETELNNWQSALRCKLFVYLWDDVLRHKPQERERLFLSKFGTFGELYNSFPKAQVFGLEADILIRKFGTSVENLDG